MESILVVEPDEKTRLSLLRLLSEEGYDTASAINGEDALEMLTAPGADLVISEIHLPAMDGLELLRKARDKYPEQLVILMTSYPTVDNAISALRGGAYDFIAKPIIRDEVRVLAQRALRQRHIQSENELLRMQIDKEYDFSHIIGESPRIRKTLEEVARVSESRSNILIVGETGTGKELIARAIHHNSDRRDKPFVPINCAAIPDNLMESELFGHVKGAFTGAVTRKKGLFEEANGGTVFMDEIGEMSVALQSKLLRVMEDQEVRPVGGNQATKVNLRFISATNRDLQKLSASGQFREDLYYRINTIQIMMPPLRERPEDIPVLAMHFAEKYATELGKSIKHITGDTAALMMAYQWPGNIRELRNIMERAVLLADGSIIRPEHLPEGFKKNASPVPSAQTAPAVPESALSIEDYTKQTIIRCQDILGEQQIADLLGITRKSLWEKRKRWGIRRPGEHNGEA